MVEEIAAFTLPIPVIQRTISYFPSFPIVYSRFPIKFSDFFFNSLFISSHSNSVAKKKLKILEPPCIKDFLY